MDFLKPEYRAEYDGYIEKARQKAELLPWWRVLTDKELEELLLEVGSMSSTANYYPEISNQAQKDFEYAKIFEEYLRRLVGDSAIGRFQWGLWSMWQLGWLAGREWQEKQGVPKRGKE